MTHPDANIVAPLAALARPQTAVIVGVHVHGEDSESMSEDLLELEALLATLRVAVVAKTLQRRHKLTPNLLVGEGKVAELKALIGEHGATLCVFDRPLSGPQVRNLEQALECSVIDRTAVILEIFGRHARSAAAKVQVEIAKLEYQLPRMVGAWGHFQRQRGGHVQRGMGETQIEIDRRRTRERLSRLHRQLETICKERQNQRKARSSELKVAIVGYTNSGKTSIMHALTRSQTAGEDVLFATLDASVRVLEPSSRPKVLLSDTVGFIRNLPHSLVASFRSTLEEVVDADLLLHVVDVSHPNYRVHMSTTASVLLDIGAREIPVMYVFNKMDRLDDALLPRLLRRSYKNSVFVSALREGDTRVLREQVLRYFRDNLIAARLLVGADDQTLLSLIYRSCLILSSEFREDATVLFSVRASPSVLAKLSSRIVEVDEPVDGADTAAATRDSPWVPS